LGIYYTFIVLAQQERAVLGPFGFCILKERVPESVGVQGIILLVEASLSANLNQMQARRYELYDFIGYR
jgi:hypothetical protein